MINLTTETELWNDFENASPEDDNYNPHALWADNDDLPLAGDIVDVSELTEIGIDYFTETENTPHTSFSDQDEENREIKDWKDENIQRKISFTINEEIFQRICKIKKAEYYVDEEYEIIDGGASLDCFFVDGSYITAHNGGEFFTTENHKVFSNLTQAIKCAEKCTIKRNKKELLRDKMVRGLLINPIGIYKDYAMLAV